MLIDFSEVQLAGKEEDDGADGGEARIAAGLALGGLEEALKASRKPLVWRMRVQSNSTMLAAILVTWASECVRGLRA